MENILGNIVNDSTRNFILEHTHIHMSNDLKKIYEYALENRIPIIDKEVQSILKMFLSVKKPKKILEFGTAIGFSSLLMYEELKGNVSIVTMERDKQRINVAKNNFKLFNCEDKIKILEGDCFENIKLQNDNYDFIFVDSSKSHYKKIFDSCIQNLNKDGIMVFDNIMYKGMIVSDELVERRKKTIVKNMRNFIQDIVKDENYFVSILPIGDGVMILRRNN